MIKIAIGIIISFIVIMSIVISAIKLGSEAEEKQTKIMDNKS